ncbi:MAG: spore germination protein, partial [Clostridia bacterium]|nr:spore germination protein [Clostridia bacterium]
FPSVIELLLMDFSFEMIRESGIRMPNPIGSVLGIVGGLILGQAAVSAKIVSPIMIIVVALTGIGSFATADYSLSWSYRILKIIFILVAASLGFFGIALGIFTYAMLIAGSASFGVPFLSPIAGNNVIKDAVFVPPVWKTERRPSFLKTKAVKKGDKISKKWQKGK